MSAIIFYVLQVVSCSGLLYTYYHFFLRNKKFHQYNRYFLLCSVVISLIVPFLEIPVYFSKEEIEPSILLKALVISGDNNPAIETAQAIAAIKDSFWSNENILLILYVAVAAVIGFRLLTALNKIYRLRKKYASEKMEEIHFVKTNAEGTPFSFFNWLFWNNKIALDSSDGKQIFRHEIFHIRQKHSWDIVLLETIKMIYWINPFFHLISREVKVIHEFLADEFAVNENDEWKYAELLLMHLLGSPNNRFVTPFFHTQIKRRIAMITSSKKTSYQYIRKLLVLPILAIIVSLFAFKYKTNDTSHYLEKTITVVIDAGHGSGTGVSAIDGSTTESVLTLALARKVKSLNKNDGVRVILTRETEKDVDLRKRAEFTNVNKADLFISLHFNSDPSPSKSGFEIMLPPKNAKFVSENRILGEIGLNYFSNVYKTDKTLKEQKEGIWVLDQSNCPAILVECGYLSNQEDLAFVKDEKNQDKIANAILQSIEQFSIQKEAPDFEEKKKQVLFSTKPVIEVSSETMIKQKDTVFEKVDEEALFPGGDGGFAKYLDRYMNKNIATVNKAPGNEYTVWIKFIVNKDGSLRAITPLTSYGYGMEKEAMKMIRMGPKWTPAKQGAKNVSAYRKVKFDFTVNSSANFEYENERVFEKVEIESSFPGGHSAWADFLDKNLNKHVMVDNKAPANRYSVLIQFTVDKSGHVSDVNALTNNGFGMEAEAIRALKTSPKWLPAMIGNQKVTSYKTIFIEFSIPVKSETTWKS